MAHLHDPAAAYSEMPPAQQEGAFASPAPYRDGAIFTGKFAPSNWPTSSKAQSVDVGVNRNAGGELSRTFVAITPAGAGFSLGGFNGPVLPWHNNIAARSRGKSLTCSTSNGQGVKAVWHRPLHTVAHQVAAASCAKAR